MIGAQYASGASVAFFSPEYRIRVTRPSVTWNVAWQYAPLLKLKPPTRGIDDASELVEVA